MDQRATQLRSQPGDAYWDALVWLARLYGEGNQRNQVEEKIVAMRKLNSEHPDAVRAAQIEELQGISEAQAAAKTHP
jgi:hypothetical protein